VFPPVVTNKGEGIRRLIDEHQLQAVIYFGDAVSDTDAFPVLPTVRAEGHCMTLSVGLLHPDSPARPIKSADVVLDGPMCAKAVIEYLVEIGLDSLTHNRVLPYILPGPRLRRRLR